MVFWRHIGQNIEEHMLQGVSNAPITPQIWVLGRILLYIFLLNKGPTVLVYGAFNFVFAFFYKIVNSSSLCISKGQKFFVQYVFKKPKNLKDFWLLDQIGPNYTNFRIFWIYYSGTYIYYYCVMLVAAAITNWLWQKGTWNK